MYLCQEMADAKLCDIADHFNLGHPGSVSFITHQVRKRKREERSFARRIEAVVDGIVKQMT